QRTLLAHDGLMPHSALTQAILADHGGSARALLAAVQDAGPAALAELAPRVIHAAAHDDVVASTILREGADYLLSCLNVLGFHDASRLCLTGGIGPAYRDYLPPAVQTMIVAPVGNALDGAVLLARRLAEGPS
ncbi:MAG: N-acetylglucosamine kinase, partial [Pseudomonadota bacterium]